jgi:hypothetical protein
MDTGRLNLPVLIGAATVDDAIKVMRSYNVSASVVTVGDAHYLLDFPSVAQLRRQRAIEVVHLVHGYALPRVKQRDLVTWFAEPLFQGRVPRAPTTRRYALLDVSGEIAEVAMRPELLSIAGAPPVMYECSVNSVHGPYSSAEVGNPPLCPSLSHTPPRPAAVLIV